MASQAAFGAMHVSEKTDFIAGENTNGWTISASQWKSPAYPAPVASFTASGTNLSDGATLSISYSQNSFTVTGTGSARLASFSADYETTRLATPEDIAVTNMLVGSFSASWPPVAGARGYRLSFYTNRLDGASDGTAIFSEDFSKLEGKGNAIALDNSFNANADTNADWTCETCYIAAGATGIVQVGSSKYLGWLSFQVPDGCLGAGRTLRLRLSRHSSSGADMPVTRVSSGGQTNILAVLQPGTEMSEHLVPLPFLASGDRIYVNSPTNKMNNASQEGRIFLDSVHILEGCDPGHLVLDRFATAETSGTFFATNGMPAVEAFVTLTALAVDASDDSEESIPFALDLANPPLMPILRAVPISTLDGGTYETDFAELAVITAKTDWYNGVWPMPYWMGYNDRGELAGDIYRGTTGSTYTGFFAVSSVNEPDMGMALGFRAAKERDGHFGIAFLNDTRTPRVDFSLTCAGVQWNYRNTIPMTNTVEYLVTNELVDTAAPGDWKTVKALEFTPPYTTTYNDGGADCWRGGPRTAALDGVSLGIGEYLVIRFSDWRLSGTGINKGGAGLESFSISSSARRMATYMTIR